MREGGGDPGALRLRQPRSSSRPLVGQFEQPLAAVLGAAVLDDKALAHQLAQHPVEALLGDPQDAEQVADRHLRMPPDEMHDPVMRAPETVCARIASGSAVKSR